MTEHQGVSVKEVDMLVGSLAGPLCAGGGFCAGSSEIVEHQRLSASAYTFSAALPAMLATTASEVLAMLETNGEMLALVRENIKTMWAQLDPRSEWVHCTSAMENPIMILVLKAEVVASRKLSISEQEQLLQEVVDEVSGREGVWARVEWLGLTWGQALANGVMMTRLKSMPRGIHVTAKEVGWELQPGLKVCLTLGLTRKEVERTGTVIRHAITKVMKAKR